MPRILIISDVHGNCDALRAILERVDRWDHLWVLGDLVDYGPEPHVVVDYVRGLRPDLVVMGNHDYAVAYSTDCMCAPELHDLSEYTRREISLKLLTEEQVVWLRSLPTHRSVEVEGLRVFAVHGSPRNKLYGYLRPTLTQEELMMALTPSIYSARPRPIDADIVTVGHTHIQSHFYVGPTRVLNPGSVGQPRDGDPRASYAVLDTESMSAELRRVEYDVRRVVEKLRSLGLEPERLNRLARILTSGSV